MQSVGVRFSQNACFLGVCKTRNAEYGIAEQRNKKLGVSIVGAAYPTNHVL